MGSEVKDITDDLPFEIPDSWVWCRLNDIIILISGTDLSPDKYNSNNKGIPYITGASNFINSILNINRWTEHPTAISNKGDLLITSKGTIGEMAYNNVGVIHIARQVMAIRSLYHFVSYIRILLETYITSLKEAAKSMIPGISRQDILQCYFPLPPLAEQVRIVAKIEKFEPLIAEYDKLEQQASKLDEEIYDKLKKSILQYAIQGKLVPQDPNDEPASVLLERIRAEKKAKLGKKYVDSYIYKGDDNCYYEHIAGKAQDELVEVPFDIPDNWAWVRWGNLSFSIQYGYNAPAKESGRIKMVRISDIHNNEVDWEHVPFCDINETDIKTYLLKENDILFARTGGTVGKSYLVTCVPEEAIYAGYLIRTQYSAQLSAQYLKYFMESSLYWMQLKDGTIATAQPNCNGQTLSKMILPLPPLAEQKRVVAKINEIFAML